MASLIPQGQGGILTDGVDISTIKLRALREQPPTITRDPYLFSRSLQSTLDPDGVMDDRTLKGRIGKSSV